MSLPNPAYRHRAVSRLLLPTLVPQIIRCTSKHLLSRSRPTASSRPLRTMGNSQGHCSALRKASRSPSMCTTTRTRRSNCIGTVRWCRLTWMEPQKKAHHLFMPMVNAGSYSLRDPQDFVSTTRTNRAGADLSAGQYGGEVGPVYIEPKHEPGNYDREIFLGLKEFEPTFSRGGDMAMDFLSPATKVKALKEQGESTMRASLAKRMPRDTKSATVLLRSMAGCCTTGTQSA